MESGETWLVLGKTRISSEATREEGDIVFAVLQDGNNNCRAGVKLLRDDDSFSAIHEEVRSTFPGTNTRDMLALMEKYFGNNIFSLEHILKMAGGEIMNKKTDNTSEKLID